MSHHWVSNPRHFNSLGQPASTAHLSHHKITLVAWQTQSDLAPTTLPWQPCFLPWFPHLLSSFCPGYPTYCPPCSLAALAALLALTALLAALVAPFGVVLTVILLYVMCCTVTKSSFPVTSQIKCSQPWIRLENIKQGWCGWARRAETVLFNDIIRSIATDKPVNNNDKIKCLRCLFTDFENPCSYYELGIEDENKLHACHSLIFSTFRTALLKFETC